MTRWWSISFVIDEADAGPLSRGEIFDVMHHEGVRRISVGPRGVGESEEVASLKLEAQAASAADAQQRGEHLLHTARRAAHLPDAIASIAWVAPLADSNSSSARFLEKAEDLLEDEGSLDLAVVAAQVHLEIQVRTLIEHASEDNGPDWVEVLVRSRGLGNLNNRQTQALIRALLRFDVNKSPHWGDYKAHNVRRNAIVHEGLDVQPEEATASVAVVRALCIEMADAAMG